MLFRKIRPVTTQPAWIGNKMCINLFFFLSRVLFPFADQVWQQQQGLDHKDGVACQRQSKKRNIPIKVIRIFNNSPENGWGVMADNGCIPTHRDIESQRTRQQHSQSQHDEFRECHFWLLVNHQRVWRKRKNSFLWFQSNTHTRAGRIKHTHTHTEKCFYVAGRARVCVWRGSWRPRGQLRTENSNHQPALCYLAWRDNPRVE